MQRISVACALFFLCGCGENSNPAAPSARLPVCPESETEELLLAYKIYPEPGSELHVGDRLSIDCRFCVLSSMLPASAGIVYIREHGEDGLIMFSFLPFVQATYMRQELQTATLSSETEIEFVSGHEINAMFIISKPDFSFPEWGFLIDFVPPEPGKISSQIKINWDNVAYKRFIPLHYVFVN